MRLQGRHIHSENIHTVVHELLSRVPSGFQRAIVPLKPHDFTPSEEKIYGAYLEALRIIDLAEETKNPFVIRKEEDILLKTLEVYKNTPDMHIETGICYQNLGRLYEVTDDRFLAQEAYLQAKEIFWQNSYEYGLIEVLPKIMDYYADILYATDSEDEKNKIYKEMQDLAKFSFDMSDNLKSRDANSEAFFIGQRQFGFSDDQPIGTTNVHDCVTIIIQEPKSKKTVLAHLDYMTNPDEIHRLFAGLPALSGQNMYQVRLLGGRYFDFNSEDVSSNSSQNILNSLRLLSSYPTKIVSAQLGHRGQISSVVVDPKTFDIYHQIPRIGLEDDLELVGFLCGQKGENQPLLKKFDLTTGSDETAPIPLRKGDVQNFTGLVPVSKYPLYEYYAALKASSPALPFKKITTAYALSNFEDKIYDRVKQIALPFMSYLEKSSNLNEPANAVFYDFKHLISTQGFHVGKNAAKFDEEFVTHIQKVVFEEQSDGSYLYKPDMMSAYTPMGQGLYVKKPAQKSLNEKMPITGRSDKRRKHQQMFKY